MAKATGPLFSLWIAVRPFPPGPDLHCYILILANQEGLSRKIFEKIKKPTRTKSRNGEDEEKKSRNSTLENIGFRKDLEKF